MKLLDRVDDIIKHADKFEKENDGQTIEFWVSEYNGYSFTLTKEDYDEPWYIVVGVFEAGVDYDGWWAGSEENTIQEALIEAMRGSMIFFFNEDGEK